MGTWCRNFLRNEALLERADAELPSCFRFFTVMIHHSMPQHEGYFCRGTASSSRSSDHRIDACVSGAGWQAGNFWGVAPVGTEQHKAALDACYCSIQLNSSTSGEVSGIVVCMCVCVYIYIYLYRRLPISTHLGFRWQSWSGNKRSMIPWSRHLWAGDMQRNACAPGSKEACNSHQG